MLLENVDLLLISDCYETPYVRYSGPYVLASYLRRHGLRVQVVDYFSRFTDTEIETIVDVCVGSNTKAVGVSDTFSGKPLHELADGSTYGWPFFERHDRIRRFIGNVKRKNPKTRLLMGGQKTTQGLSAGYIDTYFHGFAEQSLLAYLQSEGHEVPRVVKEATIPNWKDIPTIHHESDNILEGETLPLEVSRGCIFNCKFCSYPRRNAKDLNYIKSEEAIYQQLLHNYEQYGTTCYTLLDDTHNDSKAKLETIRNVLDRLPFSIEFATYLRLDLIAKDMSTAELLIRNGLRGAFFGIETLHKEAGRLVGKGLEPDETRKALRKLRELWGNEVGTQGAFILGLPKQPEADVILMCEEVCDPSFPLHGPIFFPLIMYPGRTNPSPFEKNPSLYGIRLEEGDRHGYWHNSETGMDFERAIEIQNEYTTRIYRNHRRQCGGFLPIMAVNLGIKARDLIGMPARVAHKKYNMQSRESPYLAKYKAKVLGTTEGQ
jgi:hypothetical protein